MLDDKLFPIEELPPGWTMKPLAEVCSIFSGGTPAKSNNDLWRGVVPWVSGKDMKTPRLRDSIDHVSEEAIGAGTRLAPEGSVLILVRGMGLAKDLPVALALRPLAFNQDIKALVPKRAGTGAFIRAAIYQFRQRLLSRIVPSAHGTMTLNLDDVETFSIPMPSDDREAAAISAVLDLVMDKAELASAEQATAQDLKHSTMRTLFTHGLRGEKRKETVIGSIPERWEVATIGDLALNTQYGLSVRGRPSGTYPILRMNCQEDGAVHYRNLQFADLDSATYEAFRLIPGDLLFNRTNSIELVGRMAIVDDERPAVFASYLVRLAVDGARCLPHFLNYFMNWSVTQAEIKKLASRAVGQANINASKLRTVRFPLPPTLEEQREIVTVLGAVDRKIDLHKRKRAVLDELFKSLLHKLITGETRVGDLNLSVLGDARVSETAA